MFVFVCPIFIYLHLCLSLYEGIDVLILQYAFQMAIEYSTVQTTLSPQKTGFVSHLNMRTIYFGHSAHYLGRQILDRLAVKVGYILSNGLGIYMCCALC